MSSPAVVDNVVYIRGWPHNVYALWANNGTQKWSFTTGSQTYGSSPAVVNGVVYVGSYDHKLYAIDAATGKERWNFTTGGWISCSPAVIDGIVYFGSFDHKVYAVYATNGSSKWTSTTGGEVDTSPAVANGVVYVGNWDIPPNFVRNHNFYAINAATGTAQWSQPFKIGGAVYSSPAVANGVVYVGSFDSNVYAIGTESVSTPTTLTVSAPSTASINQNFTINGTLSAGTTGIGSQTITLQRSTDNATWKNVTTNVTNATGGYQFSKNESVAGTYSYRTAYDGNATYTNATSNPVNVTVLGGGSWTSIGGQVAWGTGPAASSWGTNRLDVFVEGTNGALYQKTWTGPPDWSYWASLGGG